MSNKYNHKIEILSDQEIKMGLAMIEQNIELRNFDVKNIDINFDILLHNLIKNKSKHIYQNNSVISYPNKPITEQSTAQSQNNEKVLIEGLSEESSEVKITNDSMIVSNITVPSDLYRNSTDNKQTASATQSFYNLANVNSVNNTGDFNEILHF